MSPGCKPFGRETPGVSLSVFQRRNGASM